MAGTAVLFDEMCCSIDIGAANFQGASLMRLAGTGGEDAPGLK